MGELADAFNGDIFGLVSLTKSINLLPRTPTRLGDLGIIRSRAETIRLVSKAVVEGQVRFDDTQSVDEVCKALVAIKGIGEWTAQYVAMRALKDPDAFPASDLGLLRAFDAPEKDRMKPKELKLRAQAWRPWRSYAALLLWSEGSGG